MYSIADRNYRLGIEQVWFHRNLGIFANHACAKSQILSLQYGPPDLKTKGLERDHTLKHIDIETATTSETSRYRSKALR